MCVGVVRVSVCLSFHLRGVCFSEEKNGLFIVGKMKVALEISITVCLLSSVSKW